MCVCGGLYPPDSFTIACKVGNQSTRKLVDAMTKAGVIIFSGCTDDPLRSGGVFASSCIYVRYDHFFASTDKQVESKKR